MKETVRSFYCAGSDVARDVTALACVGTNRSLTLDLQKRVAADGAGSKHATVARLAVDSANQKLSLAAHGCMESLKDVEVSPLGPKRESLFHHSGRIEACCFFRKRSSPWAPTSRPSCSKESELCSVSSQSSNGRYTHCAIMQHIHVFLYCTC